MNVTLGADALPEARLQNNLPPQLRSVLTLFGLVVAIVAFGLMQTVVNAW